MIYSWSEKEETVENMISEVNLEFFSFTEIQGVLEIQRYRVSLKFVFYL